MARPLLSGDRPGARSGTERSRWPLLAGCGSARRPVSARRHPPLGARSGKRAGQASGIPGEEVPRARGSRHSGPVFRLSPHGPAGSGPTGGNADRAILFDVGRFPVAIRTSGAQPGRRPSPSRFRPPDRAGTSPASPGPPDGRVTGGRPADRASPPPARGAVVPPVPGGRPESGCRAPVPRTAVRPASVPG